MRYWRVVTACVIVAGVMTVANVALPDVVLETADLRLVIGDDGVCRSMTAKATGKEYLATEGRAAAFSATIGGKNFPASSVALSGDALTVQFGRNDATARMR
ncbi:hypothetical protein FJY63_07400, partial [Candidatus Sumerlaeota bacterium]|nr:hypothetical protein [Candidatus Sumerlaeota bacterium]